MSAIKITKQKPVVKKIKTEERLLARPVSRGVAIGKVICLHGRQRQFYRFELTASQVELETKRYETAIRLAVKQLKKISINNYDKLKKTKTNILAAHLLILEDKTLHAAVENIVLNQKVNAEWAVKTVTDGLVAKYKTIPDERFRERYIDLEDVADRILTALGGGKSFTSRLDKNSIIVAKEVRPSTLIELAKSQPLAVITENGGWTSHTFILAREMNLPAVTGVKGVLRHLSNGDEIIVDGFNGEVIINPEEETLSNYSSRLDEFRQTNLNEPEILNSSLKTLDGREIKIKANLDLPKGYAQAKRLGASGVGLYRSEFLFNQFKGFPSEQEQIQAYQKIAKLVGGDGVNIRTFDLSIEQLTELTEGKEKNPALGLRAIRLGFTHLKEFRKQLSALLQASAENNIKVILPMISDVAEIIKAKSILQRQRDSLKRKRIKFGNLELGAMIEVPSAVLTIEEIAGEVDFLCLGTNDLVQYLLAVDRDNETVADWFRTLHPAVLRAVRIVLQAAAKLKKPVIICGEMAGSPAYVPILIGLGAVELSMNLNSVTRVRKIVSGIAYEETQVLLEGLEKCRTADEIESFVTEFYQQKWSHLFPKELFPTRKK